MRVGVIGVGYWGKKVIPEYATMLRSGDIDGISVFDADSAATKNVSNSYPEIEIANDIDSMMGSIDALHICTPNSTHYELAMKAFDHGLDVLIEKPLTNESLLAHKLVDRSLSDGLILQVGNIFRFTRVLPEVKKLLDLKEIGNLSYIRFDWTWVASSVNATLVDVRWDIFPHVLDILDYLTESWIKEYTFNESLCLLPSEIPVAANLGGVLKNSLSFYVHASLIDFQTRKDVEIVGDAGTISFNATSQQLQVIKRGAIIRPAIVSNNTILEEVSNFVSCIKTRKNYPNSSNVGARIVGTIEDIIYRGIKTCL